MTEVFLQIVNMSIAATWLVLAVLLFRLLLKKAPKWVHVVLWGLVAVRLVCPFTLESALSLIPSSQTISPEILSDPVPTIDSGITAINSSVNPVISQTFAPASGDSANPLQIWIPAAATVWLGGIVLLLAYTAVSCWRLRSRVKTAVLLRDNIYQSEQVPSPFVLGLWKPKIYLPFSMAEADMRHVIAHEQAHIRRGDHWWKPLGFLLLTLHWFNPILWVAYILLCRDIELACDEKVIRELGTEQRADYSQALLSCSVSRRMIAACPLAFGEVGVKMRVKSVLSYKKPAFWLVLAAAVVFFVLAVCFLTDPLGVSVSDITDEKGYTILAQDQVEVTLYVPKDALPEDVYTQKGHTFGENEVIVYQTHTSTVYLEHVKQANEGDEQMYFTFNIAYDLPKAGSILLPYKVKDGSTMSYAVILPSSDLTDAVGTYPDALGVRAHGPGERFSLYVDTDACRAAAGTMKMQVYLCELAYAKDGSGSDGAEASGTVPTHETVASLPTDDRLAVGAYTPVECVYMSPLSSYSAFNLSEDFRYVVTEDSFVTEYLYSGGSGTIDHVDWHWKTRAEGGKDLAFLKDHWFGDFTLGDDCLYQKLDGQQYIFKDDGKLYLIRRGDGRMEETVFWSIYILEPEANT